jgi:hypothetical protein
LWLWGDPLNIHLLFMIGENSNMSSKSNATGLATEAESSQPFVRSSPQHIVLHRLPHTRGYQLPGIRSSASDGNTGGSDGDGHAGHYHLTCGPWRATLPRRQHKFGGTVDVLPLSWNLKRSFGGRGLGTSWVLLTLHFQAHKDVVRGLRWLGNTPRLVSFSCKKEKHGWRNCLIVTDMRRCSRAPATMQCTL